MMPVQLPIQIPQDSFRNRNKPFSDHGGTDGFGIFTNRGVLFGFTSVFQLTVGDHTLNIMEITKRSDGDKSDPGTKSEGEDDSQTGHTSHKKGLGRTPNHLTLR
jgi:hypothetical protein